MDGNVVQRGLDDIGRFPYLTEHGRTRPGGRSWRDLVVSRPLAALSSGPPDWVMAQALVETRANGLRGLIIEKSSSKMRRSMPSHTQVRRGRTQSADLAYVNDLNCEPVFHSTPRDWAELPWMEALLANSHFETCREMSDVGRRSGRAARAGAVAAHLCGGTRAKQSHRRQARRRTPGGRDFSPSKRYDDRFHPGAEMPRLSPIVPWRFWPSPAVYGYFRVNWLMICAKALWILIFSDSNAAGWSARRCR